MNEKPGRFKRVTVACNGVGIFTGGRKFSGLSTGRVTDEMTVTVAPTAMKFRMWEERRQVFCRQTM
jgi:hypothetical protein